MAKGRGILSFPLDWACKDVALVTLADTLVL